MHATIYKQSPWEEGTAFTTTESRIIYQMPVATPPSWRTIDTVRLISPARRYRPPAGRSFDDQRANRSFESICAKTSCRWDRWLLSGKAIDRRRRRRRSSILSASCESQTIGQTDAQRQFDRYIIHHDHVKRFAARTYCCLYDSL